MITAIKKIQGIGRYEKYEDNVNIHKNQVIFGFNGAGKSTLSDILYSLSGSNRSVQTILARKTLVKEDGTEPPKTEITFATDTTDLVFEEGNWNRNEEVLVFNDQYIDEYLFIGKNYTADGRAINFGKREKEISEKILECEESIQSMLGSVNEILINNKQTCEKLGLGKTRISSNWNKRVQSISNLELYKMAEKDTIRKALQDESKHDARLKKIRDWITSLEKSAILFDKSKANDIKKLSILLATTPRITSREILEHIEHSMTHRDVNWLIKGKYYQKDNKVCPFCGQKINNEEYKILSQKLEKYINSRQKERADNITSSIRKLVPFFDEGVLELFLHNLTQIIKENETNNVLRRSTVNLIEKLLVPDELEQGCFDSLREKINAKVLNPYMEEILTENEIAVCNALVQVIQKISKLVEVLEDEYKNIENKIAGSKEYEVRTARYEASFGSNSDNFKQMINLAKNMISTEEKKHMCQQEIDKLVDENRLQRVNAFLEELNVNFKVKIKDNQSYVQIKGYQPKMYGKDNKILCSEGERRMLAFAYFLQEVNAVAGKKIIVVDDPISSLDLNRKSIVAYKVVNFMKEGDNQVIVLSHDISFVEKIDSLSKSLKPELNLLELCKGENPLKILNIHDYLISDECVYEQIIHAGETSLNESDKIIALMALRPYAYLKTRGVANGDEIYSDIEKVSTYFAHSIYSRNESIKYKKGRYSTRLLKAYCNKVKRVTKSFLDVNCLVPDAYTFWGFDYQTAWNLYESISVDTIIDLRRKALVLRVVLETSLFKLIDKRCLDPEHIGDAYNAAARKAVQRTNKKLIQELNDNILRLYKLYNFSKKYHHGAEGGSTLGLSSLNAEEMMQFDREIHAIHNWILAHPEKCNPRAS